MSLRSIAWMASVAGLVWAGAAHAQYHSMDDILRAASEGRPLTMLQQMADSVTDTWGFDTLTTVALLRSGMSADLVRHMTDGAHPTEAEIAEARRPGQVLGVHLPLPASHVISEEPVRLARVTGVTERSFAGVALAGDLKFTVVSFDASTQDAVVRLDVTITNKHLQPFTFNGPRDVCLAGRDAAGGTRIWERLAVDAAQQAIYPGMILDIESTVLGADSTDAWDMPDTVATDADGLPDALEMAAAVMAYDVGLEQSLGNFMKTHEIPAGGRVTGTLVLRGPMPADVPHFLTFRFARELVRVPIVFVDPAPATASER